MLVLLGPDFEGTEQAYSRLAKETGLVAYDLRSRVRPGAWGVVKLLADTDQAKALASALRSAGFRPVLVDREVAHQPDRRIVLARGLTLNPTDFVLHLSEGDLVMEYSDMTCIVRGEVRPGRSLRGAPSAAASSSATFRAVVPTTDPPGSREGQPSAFEAYHAADLHFASVSWIARLDARLFEAHGGEPGVRALDALVEELAARAKVRVDRAVRTSSLASFAEQPAPMRSAGGQPSLREGSREQSDERFDPYSRLIGEAEREAKAPGASVTPA